MRMQRSGENKENEFMPKESFIHPISVRTYLSYFGEGNEEIDFAKFDDKKYMYEKINSIEKPLFLRWGNVYEYVSQNLDELVNLLKSKIKNKQLDISYIDGADHGYGEKEEELGKQIVEFIKTI